MRLDVFLPPLPPGGDQLLMSLILIVGLLLGRTVYQGVRSRRREGERLLILGTSPVARWVVEEIGRRPELGRVIVDVVEDTEKLDIAIEKTRPDRIVVKHISLWLDVRILFETAKAVFTGRGLARPVMGATRRENADRLEAA